MRTLIACLIMFIIPPLGYYAFKHYQAAEVDKQSARVGQLRTRGEVLFFNASWCGPCRQMKPIVTQLRREGFRMRDVDVDKNRSLAQKYKIHGIPTFVFLENGAEVRRFSGGTSSGNLKQLCSNPIYH